MSTLTVDDLIAIRLKTWFPTLDIGTAVDIPRVRKDLEAFAAGVKSDLLAEGQATREKLLADIEKLPRYEPELRQGPRSNEAEQTLATYLDESREKPGDHQAAIVLASAELVPAAGFEAAMVAIEPGQPASFVAIQDIRRVCGA